MRKRIVQLIALGTPLLCLFALVVYNIPYVNERLSWRIDNLRAQVKYALNPPEKMIFVPTQQQETPLVQTATPTVTASATATSTPAPTRPGPTATPRPSDTPTATITPIPASVRLSGIRHEYQKWNNCGPANLAMALSYWNWQGDQYDTAAYMKPNPRDKNVMPYEMEAFVENNTSFQAIVRVGGNLELLKQFIAAGFPVIIEKGFMPHDLGWMGHYEVVSGYDDAKQVFITQDSYIMPDLPIPYEEVERFWQHFNYTYVVIYPPEREAEVLALLGPDADEAANYQHALQIASVQTSAFSGAAQFYAWYNYGTNLVRLQDYAGAAAAYDQAYAIYPSIEEKERPWRIPWYQTGPYFAYFYSGRYYDVLTLATTTISATEEAAIEESWYWRAMAKNALGDVDGAISDLRESLVWHPNFAPSLEFLKQLGVEP